MFMLKVYSTFENRTLPTYNIISIKITAFNHYYIGT